MARVTIGRESPSGDGWAFAIDLGEPGSPEHRRVSVRLSWADYDHWGRGTVPPARIVEDLIHHLLETHPEHEFRDRFDAATIRRLYPEIDQRLRHPG